MAGVPQGGAGGREGLLDLERERSDLGKHGGGTM